MPVSKNRRKNGSTTKKVVKVTRPKKVATLEDIHNNALTLLTQSEGLDAFLETQGAAGVLSDNYPELFERLNNLISARDVLKHELAETQLAWMDAGLGGDQKFNPDAFEYVQMYDGWCERIVESILIPFGNCISELSEINNGVANTQTEEAK